MIDWLDQMFHGGRLVIGFVLLLVLALAAVEISFRVGRHRRKAASAAEESEIGVIQGGALGLLALLLAFTLAMAVSRFDTRKELVVNEANAIGTAYLRTQLLAPEDRGELQKLLRHYMDLRLAQYEAERDEPRRQAAIREADALQNQIWSQASAAAVRDPHAVTNSLMLAALNEVIDIHAKQLAVHANRVPQIVIRLLFVVSILALGSVGYGCGLANVRHFISTSMLAVLTASVLFVIVDLDSPREGLITVGQQSLRDLRNSIDQGAPPAGTLGGETRPSGSSQALAGKVDPQAVAILRQMGETLSGTKVFSFEITASMDEPLEKGQLVEVTRRSRVTVSRPDCVAARTESGAVRWAAWFRAGSIAFLDQDANVYATEQAPGTIGDMLAFLATKYDLTMPAADLLVDKPHEALMAQVEAGANLGSEQVGGRACQHLLFRQKEIEWQIWIEAGKTPLPRKLVITYTSIPGQPQYAAVMDNWDLAPKLAAETFTFTPPPGAKQVPLAKLLAERKGGQP